MRKRKRGEGGRDGLQDEGGTGGVRRGRGRGSCVMERKKEFCPPHDQNKIEILQVNTVNTNLARHKTENIGG